MVFLSQWIQKLDDVMASKNKTDDVVEMSMGFAVLLNTAQSVIAQFMKNLENLMQRESASAGQESNPEKYAIQHCVSSKVAELLNILKNKR